MTCRLLSAFGLFVVCCSLVAQTPGEPKPIWILKGHTDPVYAVAYSPDGKALATGSFDKTIQLWDASNGKLLRTYSGPQGHQSLVLSVAFSPNGELLASGGADNFAKLWDVPARQPTREEKTGHQPLRVAVATDGKTYALGGLDGKLRIVASADGKPLAELATGSPIRGLVFVPNAPTIVTAGADRVLRYWSATDGKLLASIGTGPGEINAIHAIGGNVVTTSTDGAIRVWTSNPTPTKKLADLTSPGFQATLTGDGNFLATAAADKSVKIVNLGNGQVVGTIPAMEGVATMAWNGDHTTLAVAVGPRVQLWGTDGKARGEIPGDGKPVRALAFASNKTELITSGDDGALKIWKLPIDPKQPPMPKVVPTDAGGLRYLVGLPNGQVIVVGANNSVKAWDPGTGKESRNFGTLPAAPNAISIARDGAMLAVAAGKTVRLWQTTDGKELPFSALPVEATALAFSPDRQNLLVGMADKSATVFNLASGQPIQFFPASANPIAVALHPSQPVGIVIDSATIVQHAIQAVRSAKDELFTRGGLVGIPNTNTIIVPGSGNTLSRWNVSNLQKEPNFDLSAPAVLAAVSRNGQLLAVATAEDSILLYTLANQQLVSTFKSPARILELVFHPNGQSLAARLANQTITLWNVQFNPGQPLPAEFGTVSQSFPHPVGTTSLAFLNESQLITGSDDGAARLWKIASDLPKSLQHPNLVDCVAFNKDGTQLATACHDGVVRIYDLTKPTPALLKDIKAHVAMPLPHPVYVVAWSPDGKILASGSFDKSIKLWDPASGNLIREIKGFPEPPPAADQPVPPGHRDQVFCLAFSKDGKLLASGSSDRTLKLWDVATGNLIRDFPNPNLKSPGPGQPIPSHNGFIHALRFTSNGQYLVSAGTAPRNTGYLAVWNVADGQLRSGTEIPFGPVYGLDLAVDQSSVVLGCGPRSRTATEAEAYVVPLNLK